MAKPEIYNSTTLGPIPLSFTGRHLLQELRTCIQDAISKGDFNCNGDALSRIRGRIAQYMSRLEGKERLQTDMLRDNGVTIEYTAAMDPRTAHLAGVADLRRRYNERCPVDFSKTANFGGNPFEDKPPPVEPVKNIYSTVLPPIPKGYELSIVGGITSIAPITKVTGSKRK